MVQRQVGTDTQQWAQDRAAHPAQRRVISLVGSTDMDAGGQRHDAMKQAGDTFRLLYGLVRMRRRILLMTAREAQMPARNSGSRRTGRWGTIAALARSPVCGPACSRS